jgi:8-oxo-dGTP diphosphatase
MTLTPMCLCFLTDSSSTDAQTVLLGRKKTGFGAGKVVGLGGHVEPGETPADAAVREVYEESGLVVDPSKLRQMATVTFRFPARPEWDQVVTVFISEQTHGEARESDEITPQWFPVDQLPLDDMWDDARYWLPQVLTGQQLEADIVLAADCQTVADARLRSARPMTAL